VPPIYPVLGRRLSASPPPRLPAAFPFSFFSFSTSLNQFVFLPGLPRRQAHTRVCKRPPPPAQVAANDGLAVGDKVYAQYGDGGDEYEATIKEITAVGYLLDWADGDSMVRKL
jgi:hypothetical protein